jgi:hypothetical protein
MNQRPSGLSVEKPLTDFLQYKSARASHRLQYMDLDGLAHFIQGHMAGPVFTSPRGKGPY